MFEFMGCPIGVPPEHMQAIVQVESSGNPYAIGVVGNQLKKQPRQRTEAIRVANLLKKHGYNYSVGIAQVNQVNFAKYNINHNIGFDTCTNLKVGSKILKKCFGKYKNWGKAYSCYYSGNALTGFRHGYVAKIQKALKQPQTNPEALKKKIFFLKRYIAKARLVGAKAVKVRLVAGSKKNKRIYLN